MRDNACRRLTWYRIALPNTQRTVKHATERTPTTWLKTWATDLSRHVTKDLQMVRKHMESEAHQVIRKMHIKEGCDTTIRKAENPEHWWHQMPVQMWCDRNSHSLLVGMKNGRASLEVSLAVCRVSERTDRDFCVCGSRELNPRPHAC
jgi:hypothetical protein